MTTTQTIFALAALERCQHSISSATLADTVRRSPSTLQEETPLFSHIHLVNSLKPHSTGSSSGFCSLTHNFANFKRNHQCICQWCCRCHMQCFGDSCHTWRTVLYMARRLWFGRNNFGLGACKRSKNIAFFGDKVTLLLPILVASIGVACDFEARRAQLHKQGHS